MSVADALAHPYLEEGRLRFHSCMCSCCHTVPSTGARQFCADLDPSHKVPFDPKMEKELARMSMFELRDKMYNFVMERNPLYGIPLCINPHSAAYKNFARYHIHSLYLDNAHLGLIKSSARQSRSPPSCRRRRRPGPDSAHRPPPPPTHRLSYLWRDTQHTRGAEQAAA